MMVGFLKKLFGGGSAHTAQIKPFGATVPVPSGQTLLEAALAQGVAFPHNCTVGTCASCKCRLVSGEVSAITDFGYTLSREELAAGFILACQAALKSDVEIEVESPGVDAPPPETFAARITATRALTHDILAVDVTLERPIRYIAGQYVNISVPGISGRSFSFATPPDRTGRTEVTFFVRKVEGGAFTEKLFSGALTGQPIALDGPHGTFFLRPGDTPIIAIAGGSGLAPLISLLQDARKIRVRRDCVLLFGARTQNDLYALDEITDIGGDWLGRFTFVPILSHEPEGSSWAGARGMVTTAIDHYAGECDPAQLQAYMCGPPGMIDAAISKLTKRGVPLTGIFYDKFTDSRSIGSASTVTA